MRQVLLFHPLLLQGVARELKRERMPSEDVFDGQQVVSNRLRADKDLVELHKG